MKKTRIELTFSSGKFIAFPDVHMDTMTNNGKDLVFRHGSRNDICHVMLDKLDFMEVMEIEE